MPRCETCKHWGESEKFFEQRICFRIPGSEEAFEATEPAPAFANSDSFLNTLPDFGCVLHEPKEAGHG